MALINRRGVAFVFGGVTSYGASALAHGGGLNAEGCHNNRKTGDYHCHRAPKEPPPLSSGLYSSSPLRAAPTASPQRVMTAQAALNALGYDVGAVDGRGGMQTTNALKAFETAQGMSPLGLIDDAAIYQLVLALAARPSC